jgi:hypothetical protein
VAQFLVGHRSTIGWDELSVSYRLFSSNQSNECHVLQLNPCRLDGDVDAFQSALPHLPRFTDSLQCLNIKADCIRWDSADVYYEISDPIARMQGVSNLLEVAELPRAAVIGIKARSGVRRRTEEIPQSGPAAVDPDGLVDLLEVFGRTRGSSLEALSEVVPTEAESVIEIPVAPSAPSPPLQAFRWMISPS